MDNLNFQAKIFKAIGHPLRLKILKMLVDGELCVCKLIDNVEFTQANLSQHLKILSNAGLIGKRKKGNFSYYRILDPKSIKLLEICDEISKNYINLLVLGGENETKI